MTKTQSLIKGTFILTLTGFATRIIGFFYRIFLSHAFGEESVGLYQLIFPLYALLFSLTCAGFQTAISRSVAYKVSLGKTNEAKHFTFVALTCSLVFSIIALLFLQRFAYEISLFIIKDLRCEPLLVTISYSLPLASVHSCICGYYLGLRQTKIPAISQFIEQIIRVACVFLLWLFSIKNNITVSIQLAVIGVVLGEVGSCMYCVRQFYPAQNNPKIFRLLQRCSTYGKELFSLAIPLTANRTLLNILQSIEAISIPLRLQTFGMPSSYSLKIYGVLTGMALPCILFPSAITNSISTMLLPTIADLEASDTKKNLNAIIKKVSGCCFLLGFVCCAFFLIFGSWMGNTLFHSSLAGSFIFILAWICPFLYTNSTFLSIINGLGKTVITFCINTIGLLIRLTGVLYLIPLFGIKGYLWGLLASQLLVSVLCILYLSLRNMRSQKSKGLSS